MKKKKRKESELVLISRTAKKGAAALLTFASLACTVMPAMAAPSPYFTYMLKVPGQKSATYSSKKTLDVSSIKATNRNVKITLKSAVISGKKISASKQKVSCQYTTSDGHIVSLTEEKSSLSLTSKLLKAIAKSGKSPVIAVRSRNAYAEAQPLATAAIRERKYSKAPTDAASFINVKLGRYGTVKAGFTLTSEGFAINGKSRKNGTYAWWIAKYTPKGGSWAASDFVIAPKKPYGAGDAAYRLSVIRNGTVLTGMKLTGALIRTGDSAETWAANPTGTFPDGWKKGMTFRYDYVLSRVKGVKASSPKKSALSVRWTPDDNADGYIMECSRNRDFSLCRTQKYSGWSIGSCTASGLRSGEKYYVRVRSTRTVDGKAYYSPWSATVTATVR